MKTHKIDQKLSDATMPALLIVTLLCVLAYVFLMVMATVDAIQARQTTQETIKIMDETISVLTKQNADLTEIIDIITNMYIYENTNN